MVVGASRLCCSSWLKQNSLNFSKFYGVGLSASAADVSSFFADCVKLVLLNLIILQRGQF